MCLPRFKIFDRLFRKDSSENILGRASQDADRFSSPVIETDHDFDATDTSHSIKLER